MTENAHFCPRSDMHLLTYPDKKNMLNSQLTPHLMRRKTYMKATAMN